MTNTHWFWPPWLLGLEEGHHAHQWAKNNVGAKKDNTHCWFWPPPLFWSFWPPLFWSPPPWLFGLEEEATIKTAGERCWSN